MVATDRALPRLTSATRSTGADAGCGQGGGGLPDEHLELSVGVLVTVNGQRHPVGYPVERGVDGPSDVHRTRFVGRQRSPVGRRAVEGMTVGSSVIVAER